MRKLASIQEITALDPIPNKDRIVLATVLGWKVIVTKDFQVGDKCIYVEIDSQLPEKPEFEFLRSKKFRIRTMKMGGVLSQGICFPLSILPPGEYEVDQDVTELLGVTKYDPEEVEGYEPIKTSKATKKWYQKIWLMKYKWYRRLVGANVRETSGFPSFISKTDETRIQTAPWFLKDKNNKYVLTEKVDGTSMTACLVRHKRFLLKDKFEYIVCSRNQRLARDNSIYWEVSDKYNIENALKNLIGSRDWIAIQGECIGPKVQGNKYRKTEPELYVFNLILPTFRLGSVKAKNILEPFGFNFVPIVNENYTLPDTVEEMLAEAHGQSVLGDTLREGLVVRSKAGTISFKAVDPEFLLHYNL